MGVVDVGVAVKWFIADGKFFQALCNSPLSDRMLWVGDLPGA
jgi:hypothetical protein